MSERKRKKTEKEGLIMMSLGSRELGYKGSTAGGAGMRGGNNQSMGRVRGKKYKRSIKDGGISTRGKVGKEEEKKNR